MNIGQLKVFLTLAKIENFSKAGYELNLTQPMVTKIIKSLEEELHVKLIERTSKTFWLTNAGERLLVLASDVIYRFDRIYTELGEYKELKFGKISIAGPPTTLATYFLGFLQNIRKEYPGIYITLKECGHKDAFEMVRSHRADIGVAQIPISGKEFYIRPIIEDESMFICNRYHKYANSKSISLTDIKEEKFISLNESFKLYDNLMMLCNKAGFEPNIVYKTSLISFIVSMVSLGEGIAVLPLSLVNSCGANNIVGIPLKENAPWTMAIFVNKEHYQDIIIQKIFDLLTEYFKN